MVVGDINLVWFRTVCNSRGGGKGEFSRRKFLHFLP